MHKSQSPKKSLSLRSSDLLFFNGEFITLDEKRPHASAILVTGEKISKIGDLYDIRDLVGENTIKLDLKGKTIIPGFVDSHIHLISLGLAMQVMDLRGIASKSLLLEKIKEKTNSVKPRHWIRGYGFDEAKLDKLPTRLELDAISPNNPVYLEEITSRTCVMNSLALEKMHTKEDIKDREIDTERTTRYISWLATRTPTAGVELNRDHLTGEVNGAIRVEDQKLFYEVSKIPFIEPLDEALEETELLEAIKIAYQKVVEAGITSVHDLQLPPNGIRAYKKLVNDGEAKLRVYVGCDRNKNIALRDYIDEGLGEEQCGGRLKIGMVKLFADGRMPMDEFRKRVREAHEAGYQLAIHGTDKRHVEDSLSAIEEALDRTPRGNHRHRIEHAHILDRGLIERLRRSEVVVSSQPELTLEFEGKYPENDMVVPLRSLLKEGVVVTGGSDATTDAYSRARFPRNYSSPLTGVCFEVTRRTGNGVYVHGDEGVSIVDALKVHTINGAYASFDEDVKGTLEEGKLADMVVLSDDPFKVDPRKIKDIKVEKTIIGGRIVYSRE